jgi:hypothetical protein
LQNNYSRLKSQIITNERQAFLYRLDFKPRFICP